VITVLIYRNYHLHLYDCSMFFGNLFVYFQFQGKAHIDAHTRLSVFLVLLVIAAIGIVFLLLLRPAQNTDGEMVQKDEGSPLNALKRAFELLITKEMLLLSITFFYTGKVTCGMKFITFCYCKVLKVKVRLPLSLDTIHVDVQGMLCCRSMGSRPWH